MNLLPSEIICSIADYLDLNETLVLTRVAKIFRNTFPDHVKVVQDIIDFRVYDDLDFLERVYNDPKFKDLLFVINSQEDAWKLQTAINQKVLKLGGFGGFFAVGAVSKSRQLRLENVVVSYLKLNKRTVIDYQILAVSCECGFKKVVEFIFKENRVDCLANFELPLFMSASFGHVDLLRVILNHEKAPLYPAKFLQMAFIGAVTKGRQETLDILLQDSRCNPGCLNNRALEIAVRSGNSKIVSKLLEDERVWKTAGFGHILNVACEYGHIQVVKSLQKVSICDPSAFNCRAIKTAIKKRHADIAILLLNDERVPKKFRQRAKLQTYFASLANLSNNTMSKLWQHFV